MWPGAVWGPPWLAGRFEARRRAIRVSTRWRLGTSLYFPPSSPKRPRTITTSTGPPPPSHSSRTTYSSRRRTKSWTRSTAGIAVWWTSRCTTITRSSSRGWRFCTQSLGVRVFRQCSTTKFPLRSQTRNGKAKMGSSPLGGREPGASNWSRGSPRRTNEMQQVRNSARSWRGTSLSSSTQSKTYPHSQARISTPGNGLARPAPISPAEVKPRRSVSSSRRSPSR
ncbi:hypothetical protein B0H16DRAFT_840754 [Mycena metata]|uniref:Uncharacterized protein n=1 Tax=Mycena metata TaxID=1033252 RepID=A0AAD7N9P6_9AGAR|nr:hypothetical protein B0H16DRAFT_840754 [Mycena metata]